MEKEPEVKDQWDEQLSTLNRVIKQGLVDIKAGNVNEVAELRYTLAVWRSYIGSQYAIFDTEYANSKLTAMETAEEKMSVAQAETIADGLPVATKRRTAKELLETLNQLANACSSAIAVLTQERSLDGK